MPQTTTAQRDRLHALLAQVPPWHFVQATEDLPNARLLETATDRHVATFYAPARVSESGASDSKAAAGAAALCAAARELLPALLDDLDGAEDEGCMWQLRAEKAEALNRPLLERIEDIKRQRASLRLELTEMQHDLEATRAARDAEATFANEAGAEVKTLRAALAELRERHERWEATANQLAENDAAERAALKAALADARQQLRQEAEAHQQAKMKAGPLTELERQGFAAGLRKRIADAEGQRDAWEETAKRHHRNECYYRGLVERIGKLFGEAAFLSDDGSRQEDVLCAKVPELAEQQFVDLSSQVADLKRALKGRDSQKAELTAAHEEISRLRAALQATKPAVGSDGSWKHTDLLGASDFATAVNVIWHALPDAALHGRIPNYGTLCGAIANACRAERERATAKERQESERLGRLWNAANDRNGRLNRRCQSAESAVVAERKRAGLLESENRSLRDDVVALLALLPDKSVADGIRWRYEPVVEPKPATRWRVEWRFAYQSDHWQPAVLDSGRLYHTSEEAHQALEAERARDRGARTTTDDLCYRVAEVPVEPESAAVEDQTVS